MRYITGLAAALLVSAGHAHAAACAGLGSLSVLGAPLSSFTSFEAGGSFVRCFSFEMGSPSDPGPLANDVSGGNLVGLVATYGGTAISSIAVEGPVGIAVSNPELAVTFGNIPDGMYEVYLWGTSGGVGSGFGLVLAAIPLAAVPEPGTWALFPLGLSIAGFIRLRANDRRNA